MFNNDLAATRSLIIASLVLSESQKDQLISKLPSLSAEQLADLHAKLVAAAERDRQMLAKLSPEELQNLKHQTDGIRNKAVAAAAEEQSVADANTADLLIRQIDEMQS